MVVQAGECRPSKCQNNACQKQFDAASERVQGECTYHPGEPSFQDGYKAWSCCADRKKVTDFQEFLNIVGCANGIHSQVKKEVTREQFEKLDITENEVDTAATENSKPTNPVLDKFYPLELKVVDKLKSDRRTAIDSLKSKQSQSLEKICANNGCGRKQPEGSEEADSVCVYHPGSPMFHEGHKFWTCCKKMHDDFEKFKQQPGCTQGTHNYMTQAQKAKAAAGDLELSEINTSKYIELEVYSRLIDPETISAKCNGAEVEVQFTYFDKEGNKFEFRDSKHLSENVKLENSFVKLMSAKLQIMLTK